MPGLLRPIDIRPSNSPGSVGVTKAPTNQPRTNAPLSSTGLQGKGSGLDAGPPCRNAVLPAAKGPSGLSPSAQGAQVMGGVSNSGMNRADSAKGPSGLAPRAQVVPIMTAAPNPGMDAAESRDILGIDENRLRSSDVKGKATSLDNIETLKMQLLAMKQEVQTANVKEQQACAAEGDKDGVKWAAQAAANMNREINGALGFLQCKETELRFGKSYAAINLKITSDTVPRFTDSQVQVGGEPKQLGHGDFNTVYSVQLTLPKGDKRDGVFKPLSAKEEGAPAIKSGIPEDDPQIAMRNLATCSYAKALGFGGVVTETHVAALKTSPNDAEPTLGLVMEKAQGSCAWETPWKALANGAVACDVTKLQLLDHLTGQGDRHGENYFVSQLNGKATVKGIDNDQCFGKNLKDPGAIRNTGEDGCSYRGTGLPAVIDTSMAAAIDKLTHDDLTKMLGSKLRKSELDAAKMRLDGMQTHIRSDACRIIQPDGWDKVVADAVDVLEDDPASAMSGKGMNMDNSLFMRDLALQYMKAPSPLRQ